MKRVIYILCFWGLLVACEPCADCGKPLVFDPTVTATFINTDTLAKVTDLLKVLAEHKQAFADLKSATASQSRSNNDSITKYQKLVNDGELQYKEYLDSLLAVKIKLTALTDSLPKYTSRVTDSITTYNKIKTQISAGKVRLDSLILQENGQFIIYEDSATKYNLPLLMEANETSFRIRIKATTLNVRFTYETEEIVDQVERDIELRAVNIQVESPDSVQVSCKQASCADHETSLIFYF